MLAVSQKTFAEVFAAFLVNLSSGWFAILVIAPGFLTTAPEEYRRLLLLHLPFGIVSLLLALWLAERSKRL